jgi:hypothetical protein
MWWGKGGWGGKGELHIWNDERLRGHNAGGAGLGALQKLRPVLDVAEGADDDVCRG